MSDQRDIRYQCYRVIALGADGQPLTRSRDSGMCSHAYETEQDAAILGPADFSSAGRRTAIVRTTVWAERGYVREDDTIVRDLA